MFLIALVRNLVGQGRQSSRLQAMARLANVVRKQAMEHRRSMWKRVSDSIAAGAGGKYEQALGAMPNALFQATVRGMTWTDRMTLRMHRRRVRKALRLRAHMS